MFSKKNRKQSLSHTVHNSYKYYLLLVMGNNIFFHTFNLSHDKLFHFSSLYFFSHLTSSLSAVTHFGLFSFHIFLSLFVSFLLISLPPDNTILWLGFYFFFPHKSVNSSLTIWYFGIYQTNCTRIFFRLNNLAYAAF